MPTSIDVFAKVRGHEREELLRAAREADLLPYFRTVESPAMPVVEMEGAPRIMLASNNYLGLTGDERVMQGARDALQRYGTGLTGSRLLNGTTPLHLELERELADWMDTEDAIVFTTGHQANVGTLGTLLGPGDTVIVDSGDHASILDGVLLSRQDAPVPPQPPRQARARARARRGATAAACWSSSTASSRWRATSRRWWTSRAVRAPRRPPDGRRGARRRRAGGPRRGGRRAAGGRGPRRSAHGHLLQVARRLRGLHRRPGRGDRVPADLLARFLFTASAVPAAFGAALAALRIIRSEEGPALLAAVLDNARYLAEGLRALGYRTLSGEPVRTARRRTRRETIVTPIVPILVGDDWKAALLWRALYDGGVFTNCALHPAVPPGGALLRTSVMATHDRAVLDRALEVFARVKREFEAEHGPLPAPDAR